MALGAIVFLPILPVSASNIEKAVQAAVANHPEISRDQANASAATQAIDEASSTYLPRLDIEGAGGFELTDSPSTRATDENTRDLVRSEGSFTLTQRLFDGFDTSSRVASARARKGAAESFVGETIHRISLLAVTLYLDVLRNRTFLKAAEWNTAIHAELAGQVRELKRSGRGVGTDVDQADTRLALAESERERFRGELRAVKARYFEVVGEGAIDLTRPDLPDFDRPATADDAVAAAEASHPRIQTALNVQHALQADVNTQRAAYFPQVNLEAIGSTAGNRDGVPGQDSDFNGRVRGTYNIFNGLGDLARVRGSRNRAQAATADVLEAKRITRENVRVAYEQLITAERRLKPLRAQIGAAKRVVYGYRNQFKIGQRTLLDLLDAQNELFQARLSKVDGEFRVLLGIYELMAAIGKLPNHFNIEEKPVAQQSGR